MALYETESDVSVEIQTPYSTHRLFCDGDVTVSGPDAFTADADASFRISLTGEGEEAMGQEDGWGTSSTHLTPEQAKELGEFLVEHWDDEPNIMIEESMDDE